MSELTIDHTAAEGTILHGSQRGDGVAEILKPLGWRWGRTLGAWYVPRSRDTLPRGELLEATTAALRAAGHDVTTDLDLTARNPVVVAADLVRRSHARADRLDARADRREQRADALREAADARLARFAGGQPILVGHHSETGACRDLERGQDLTRRAIAQADSAKADRAAAASARAHATGRNAPTTVARRIARLEASQRQLSARLAQSGTYASTVPLTPEYRARLERELDDVRAQLQHWQSVRDEQLATGQAHAFGPADITAGDLVLIRGTWRTVARVNTKSVSVQTGHSWTDRVPWHEVRDHRRPESP